MPGLNGIPALYENINTYNAQFKPSTVHAKNTALTAYFERFFMQKVFSVYDIQLSESWDKSYFLYVMFCIGFGLVLRTDKYGTIFQHGQLYGYNIYYRPNKAIVTNPLLKGSRNLIINEDCGLIKLTPDYHGIYDTVSLYADMAALIMESFGVNAINAKFSYVFMSNNKTEAESFKELYDRVASGEPAAFIDRKLFDPDGNPQWMMFNQNLKQNFIGLDLLECLNLIETKFNTAMGINNANTEKRERLTIAEVNVNNQEVNAMVDVILDTMNESFQKVNDMFGLDLSIRKRESEGGAAYDDAVNNRTDRSRSGSV